MSQVYSITETTSDKENKSEAQFEERRIDKVESPNIDQTMLSESYNLAPDDSSDEGWQEAVPKGRSLTGRKSSSSRRPTLAKLNTNFINGSQSSRYRGKPTNFSSPRTNLNETNAGPSIPVPKKFVKSSSFSPKLNNSNAPAAGVEKIADTKSAPATPAPRDQIAKPAPASGGSISVQSTGKLFSYKEVALAPPGTIVKAVAEQLPKGNPSVEQNLEVSPTIVATKETHSNVATTNDVEGNVQKSIDEKRQDVVHEEQKEKEAAVVTDNTERAKSSDDVRDEVVEVKVLEENNVAVVEKNVEAGSSTTTEVDKSGCVNTVSDADAASKGASEIEAQESCHATSHDLNPSTALVEGKTQLLDNDTSVSKEKVTEGDEKHELPSGDIVSKPLTAEEEKQEEIETVKEPTKKLSAAAPPFNPSTVPVFGTIPAPGFKEHGGILPPPVNISPLLPVNPRRSPHQSATARVPYGPRISGGYNRYGNRVPRNKTVFLSGEHSTDGNPNSPPRIMNPHATEFVPCQHWVPNGYSVPPNGYMASPNGIPVSPNGFTPVSPNGAAVLPGECPASLNGIPENQNEDATSPTNSTDSAQVVDAETNLENKDQALDEENKDALSSEVSYDKQQVEAFSSEVSCEKQQVEQNPQEDVSASKEDSPKVEEKPAELSHPTGCSQEDKVANSDTVDAEKPSKCWGDYSDSEAEIIEVTN